MAQNENLNISAFWNLSGILTDFQNRPCFSWAGQNESKECYAMIKTDENLNISAESQLICTKPSEQGSFFWISRNESKECYTTIKSDENSNISAEFQQFQQKLKYLSGILTDLHQTFRTGLIFLSQSIWVQGVLCYDQNWWKLKYLSRILIDMANFAKKVA